MEGWVKVEGYGYGGEGGEKREKAKKGNKSQKGSRNPPGNRNETRRGNEIEFETRERSFIECRSGRRGTCFRSNSLQAAIVAGRESKKIETSDRFRVAVFLH